MQQCVNNTHTNSEKLCVRLTLVAITIRSEVHCYWSHVFSLRFWHFLCVCPFFCSFDEKSICKYHHFAFKMFVYHFDVICCQLRATIIVSKTRIKSFLGWKIYAPFKFSWSITEKKRNKWMHMEKSRMDTLNSGEPIHSHIQRMDSLKWMVSVNCLRNSFCFHFNRNGYAYFHASFEFTEISTKKNEHHSQLWIFTHSRQSYIVLWIVLFTSMNVGDCTYAMFVEIRGQPICY